MLSMFPLYIFLFIFNISLFLRDYNGNKAMQLFCPINIVIESRKTIKKSMVTVP